MMNAYYRRLTGSDSEVQLSCARSWSTWEMSTSRLLVDRDLLKRVESDAWVLQFAKIESYASFLFPFPSLAVVVPLQAPGL